jgi:Ni,Fe-hydrogenase maturation factor
MKSQLQEDQAESQSNNTVEAKAVAMLMARNERLISLLGCLVESVTADTAGKEISEQLKADLDLANLTLDEYEQTPLY